MRLLIIHTDKAPSSLMAKYVREFLESESLNGIHVDWQKVEHQVKWEAKADQILVLSPHKSKENIPLLSLHVPGNPCEHWVSGDDYTLNITNPLFNYRLFLSAYEEVEKANVGISFSYEVDHHGPTIQSPVVFYEIGSDESMWNREDLAELMARAFVKSLKSDKKPSKILAGFGGGHYAPKFVKATVEKGYTFSHILAKYAMECATDDVIEQALTKSTQPIDGIALDWKGLKGEQRQRLTKIAEELSLPAERL